jgi:hypothetical protein
MALWSTILQNFRLGLSSLDGAPRELWLVFLVQVVAEYTVHALDISLQVFASQEFGYSDIRAGLLYGTRGVVVAACGFGLAGLVDVVGVRRAMVTGCLLSMLGHALVAAGRQEWTMLVAVLAVAPVGEVLAKQAFQIGVLRYTDAGNKAFAFGVLYSAQNAGGAVAGFAIDLLKNESLLVRGTTVTGFRLCLATSVVTGAFAFACSLAVREGVRAGPPQPPGQAGLEPQLKPKALGGGPARDGARGDLEDTERAGLAGGPPPPPSRTPLAIARAVCRLPRFRRFFALSMLLVLGKLPLNYNNSLLPKWLPREHGRGVPFGSIVSINWTLCILLPPLLAAATHGWPHFDVIVLGVWLTAAGTFLLALSPSLPVVVAWEVVITTGECLFEPRLAALAGELAPAGMEATFYAIAGLPNFLVRWPSGFMVGWLLDSFVPMCRDATDFTGVDFCELRHDLATPLPGFGQQAGCLSPNVCLRGSPPRGGDPCLCDAHPDKRCHYLCSRVLIGGPDRVVRHEGLCPRTCNDLLGYTMSPRTMWLVVACIAIASPVLITALRGSLRPRDSVGESISPFSSCWEWFRYKIGRRCALDGLPRSSATRQCLEKYKQVQTEE